MDEIIKLTMSAYLSDVADQAETDVEHIYDLLIEMMQEEGYLLGDTQRVIH